MNKIRDEMYFQLKDNLLDKWYPKVIDYETGGFFTNLSYNFQLSNSQEKMIVTQARNIWTLSKAADFYGNKDYINFAFHGFEFLQNKIWDKKNGGFYQIRNRVGNYSDIEGWRNEKRTYGNAYGLFALASLYNSTKNESVFEFAKQVFNWLENFAHDKIHKGYFQFLTEDCKVFNKESEYKSIASDSIEVGYKDQNSSIHLLEAFTEFYNVYKSELLKERLTEMLFLIRDVITTDKGYLQLFFDEKWEPISFRNSPKDIREKNYGLDHVSFGHDYETAFLMLEASHVLKLDNDIKTLQVAKKMVDHAIENGWDENNGGFYDEGYYFENDGKCKIIKNTKTWWAQAEALNIYLIMSQIFPQEKKYLEIFFKEWEYVKNYLIDHENGDWYWGGIDREPFNKTEPKGKIWKGTYHNGRSLMNCISILADNKYSLNNISEGFKRKKIETNNFINHWKKVVEKL